MELCYLKFTKIQDVCKFLKAYQFKMINKYMINMQ